MKNTSFLCSWSGGKDSCCALHIATSQGLTPVVLLNVLNEYGHRSRSHGIPKEILEAQANALRLPIRFFESTWDDYEQLYIQNLKLLTKDYDVNASVFGDIDIEAHRAWEEKVSDAANLKPILPIWKEPKKQLVLDIIDYGIESVIVSCNAILGPDFLGRVVNKKLIEDLQDLGVDTCGENGEYHTLVTNAPLFNKKLEVAVIDKEVSSNYNFARLELI